MYNAKRGGQRLLGIIIPLLLPLLIIQSSCDRRELAKKSGEELKAKRDFILTKNDSLLSLRAKNASLKEIVEEIGRRTKVEVVGNIPEEERITIAFDKLSLEDAIKRLSKNYAYVKESGKEKGRITKITIPVSKTREVAVRGGPPAPMSKETIKEKPTRPEPFKFEFDPSGFKEKK